MSRRPHLCSPVLSFFAGLEWSLHASHLLLTRHEGRYHIGCVASLAEERKSDVRSVVDCGLYRFQHREGNKPMYISDARLQSL